MVKIDKIYTRGGDTGETSLIGGERRVKSDPRLHAVGAVDETNAAIGVARLSANGNLDAALGRIQNDLFDLGADLANPLDDNDALRMTDGQITRLEKEIDALNAGLAPLTSFVLPGGCALAAALHMARTICRRAERNVVTLATTENVNPAALRYLNRLSDLLFVMARHANSNGADDVLWVPGKTREG